MKNPGAITIVVVIWILSLLLPLTTQSIYNDIHGIEGAPTQILTWRVIFPLAALAVIFVSLFLTGRSRFSRFTPVLLVLFWVGGILYLGVGFLSLVPPIGRH